MVQAKYIPSNKQERSGDYSKSTGVRTGGSQEFPLTILAPQTYVGQTISVNPSFVWIVGNDKISYEVDFRLFEFAENGAIKQRGNTLKFQIQGGVNQFSFPSSQPPLTIGKKYLWQIATCPQGGNCQNPMNWNIQKAEFRVVELPLNVQKTLDNLTSETEKAEVYAENGFWYDALTASLKSANQGKLSKQSANLIRDLAELDDFSSSTLVQIVDRY